MIKGLLQKIFYRIAVFGIQIKLFCLSVYHNGRIDTPNLYHGRQFILDISGKGFSFRGKNLKFKNFCNISIRGNGNILIGENTSFNNYCSINCLQEITIGANCLFGESVKLYDHNHRFRDTSLPIRLQGYKTDKITIGNDCWIASGVTILKGVTIGDHVIIGAGVIVQENIPSYTIVKNEQVNNRYSYE